MLEQLEYVKSTVSTVNFMKYKYNVSISDDNLASFFKDFIYF